MAECFSQGRRPLDGDVTEQVRGRIGAWEGLPPSVPDVREELLGLEGWGEEGCLNPLEWGKRFFLDAGFRVLESGETAYGIRGQDGTS